MIDLTSFDGIFCILMNIHHNGVDQYQFCTIKNIRADIANRQVYNETDEIVVPLKECVFDNPEDTTSSTIQLQGSTCLGFDIPQGLKNIETEFRSRYMDQGIVTKEAWLVIIRDPELEPELFAEGKVVCAKYDSETNTIHW